MKTKQLLDRMRIGLWCAMVMAVLLCSFSACAAEQTERETIRVGFFAFDGYHMIEEDGTYSGYGYEFLLLVSRYLDVDFTYIGYENSWDDMQDMLQAGEIDMVTSAQETPERSDKFAFSTPIGISSAMLTMKSGNEQIVHSDYATYDGISIGLLQGNSRNEDLEEFARENEFSYKPVYFEKYVNLEQALQDGRVDAALTSSLRQTEHEQILDYFASEKFYVMMAKENTELLEKINYAIAQINAAEGDWQNDLMNKYYTHQEEKNLYFTEQEKEVIRQYAEGEHTLVVSACMDKEPYAYAENGEAKGILFDYFAMLAEEAGIPYEIKIPANRKEYTKWCDNGLIDVCLDGRFENAYQAEVLKRTPTAVYTTMQMAMVTRVDFDGKIKRLAVSDAQGLFGIEEDLIKSAERIPVKSRKDGMQAVLDGKADATFVYLYTAQQFVNQDERGLLTYTMLAAPTYEYRIAFSEQVSHELAGIFTKCIYAMPEGTIENLASWYTNYKVQDITVRTWMKIHPFQTIVSICACFLMCLFMLLWWERQKAIKLEQKRSEELQEFAIRAEKANQEKSDFLANMSHDIRTPMNAIVGIVNLMDHEADLSDKQRSYIQKLRRSAHHLLGLINDVLDMSRIEAYEITLNEEPMNLPEQIALVDNMVCAQVLERCQTFRIHMHKIRHNYLLADSMRLRQVLINLLSNAIKYTPEHGWIELDIEEQTCERLDAVRVCFKVTDNGCGMTEEVQEHIFESFRRGEASVTNKVQGTGLGMAITKSIVDLMGGKIEIDSEPGKGTCIQVTLDLLIDASVEEQVEAKSLLFLSDEEEARFNMESLLSKTGMLFCAASSEQEAEELLKTHSFEVILISGYLHSPHLREVLRRLRRWTSEDTVMFCMDYARQIQNVQMPKEADGLLQRPFSIPAMNELLRRRHSETEKANTSVLKGMRFLCAEDNELNAEILEALLENRGAVCTIYPNGAELVKAFEKIKEGDYDVVLLDIQMPNMNGLEAASAIRSGENPLGRTIPIVAMTANVFAEDVQRSMEAGMNAHISKPIDLDALEQIIRDTL